MNRLRTLLLLAAAILVIPGAAAANVILSYDGLSAKGVAVSFSADLSISGDTLTIVLSNNSVAPSANPDDVLSSFYFEIKDGLGNRPTLSYASASGDVYTGDRNNPDTLTTAGADLQAFNVGDNSWQFKSGFTLSPGADVLYFGVGTAGNNSLTPNGFNGNIVDGIDYSIYAGDISTQSLDGTLLVKDTATFTFTGLTGFTEADISGEALFGLGTQPDSTGFVPEPGTGMLVGLGLVAIASARRRSPRRRG